MTPRLAQRRALEDQLREARGRLDEAETATIFWCQKSTTKKSNQKNITKKFHLKKKNYNISWKNKKYKVPFWDYLFTFCLQKGCCFHVKLFVVGRETKGETTPGFRETTPERCGVGGGTKEDCADAGETSSAVRRCGVD